MVSAFSQDGSELLRMRIAGNGYPCHGGDRQGKDLTDDMSAPNIRLFIKPYCGWCHEAIEWLDQRGISYQKLDVTADAAAAKEMLQLTGQTKAPSIDVDGEILADFDTDELEVFWKKVVGGKA